MSDLIICDLRPDYRHRARITFWGPNGSGYTASLDRAGIYSPAEVMAAPDRFTETEKRQVIRFAVPRLVAMRLAQIGPLEGLESDGAPVVANTAENRRALRWAAWQRPEPRRQAEQMPSRTAALKQTAKMKEAAQA